jgi:arylsulfatase A-like enzyme
MPRSPKFLIVGFDGFRPEMMAPDLTPTLWRLARDGVVFRNHRCCFPSETYANLPSLVTGTSAGGHGMVANTFFEPSFGLDACYYSGSLAHVEAAARANGGSPMTTPSLGEMLAAHGKRMTVIGTCEPGGARLKHPMAAHGAGHFSFATDAPDAATPHDRAAAVLAELGPPPPLDWSLRYDDTTRAHHTYITDAFLCDVARTGLPDVSLLWYCDPDHAYHAFGIGSEEARIGIADADAGLGRILSELRDHPERENLNVLVVSDHSHITLGERVDTLAMLRDAGFKAAKTPDADADVWLHTSYCSHMRLRDPDPARLRRLCDALMQHPDVGMILTKDGDVPGTLPLAAIGARHDRSPDVYLIYRTSDDLDAHGFQGICRHDGTHKAGDGMHGGLHPKELHNLLVANGPAFAESLESDTHSGIADIVPTVAHVLGLGFEPTACGGRILHEAFAAEPDAPAAVAETLSAEHGAYAQELRLTRIGAHVYPDGGTRLA